ncbi:MAG: hypothetical protein Q8O56_10425 [Solirubrobacteraceae bacterium]|nr:hypothetical protein [Solirubrobacteraceae bacterium]
MSRALPLEDRFTRAEEKPSGAPRLALSIAEACEALGCSWDFWSEHVAPDVRIVRRGRRKLVPVVELEAWLDREAERPLGTGKAAPVTAKTPANAGVRASRAPAGRCA